MEKMKKLCSVAIATLAFGAICLPPAEAAYKPKNVSKMGGQAVKDVQKAVATLKAMPKPLRWTFYAESMGLLFMPPNGRIGHKDNGNILDGSHFIGVDGMEYDAMSELKSVSWDAWGVCCNTIRRFGREMVFSKLSNEMTAFVLENAKYQLEKMAEEQPERRDMYLAYLAKLCYLPDGKSPYGKMETKTDPGPHKQPIQYYELGGKGCKFVDTEGTEHNFDDITRKYASLGGARWQILNVCAHYVGRKDILDLCPNEVKKLRANYKKKMQELGVGPTEPKEEKAEETSEPSVKAESLAKKLGVTYRPKTNADRMGGQFKKDLDSVVKYLKSLPKSLRWCFIAERMGLMFMPQGGRFGYKDWGWKLDYSHFIGANGMEYDSSAELSALSSMDEWGANSNLTDRLGRDLVFSQFPTEVAELVLQNAKYHLEMAAEVPEARDSVLARLAQLEYLPDVKSSYVRQTWKWGQTNVVHEYRLQGPGDKALFIDSEGEEHRIVDVVDSIKDGRWSILIICAHHLGADAILALCPEEVKKLRANYKKKMQELKR